MSQSSLARPIPSLLIVGGARSGKSRLGQVYAEQSAKSPILVATAQAHDEEMKQRIADHQAVRDARWQLVEEPLALPSVLIRESRHDRILVVDCLTLWLSNMMHGPHDYAAQCEELAATVATLSGSAIFISNEVGSGIVPTNALARAFTDAQGRLNQVMASACTTVIWVCAGLPTLLKPHAPPAITL
jgi:adenosylcobinamide kinase / adenosylcobinamide-phosphate guanylyltransferase